MAHTHKQREYLYPFLSILNTLTDISNAARFVAKSNNVETILFLSNWRKSRNFNAFNIKTRSTSYKQLLKCVYTCFQIVLLIDDFLKGKCGNDIIYLDFVYCFTKFGKLTTTHEYLSIVLFHIFLTPFSKSI